jgi:hypothetical protein
MSSHMQLPAMNLWNIVSAPPGWPPLCLPETNRLGESAEEARSQGANKSFPLPVYWVSRATTFRNPLYRRASTKIKAGSSMKSFQ